MLFYKIILVAFNTPLMQFWYQQHISNTYTHVHKHTHFFYVFCWWLQVQSGKTFCLLISTVSHNEETRQTSSHSDIHGSNFRLECNRSRSYKWRRSHIHLRFHKLGLEASRRPCQLWRVQDGQTRACSITSVTHCQYCTCTGLHLNQCWISHQIEAFSMLCISPTSTHYHILTCYKIKSF